MAIKKICQGSDHRNRRDRLQAIDDLLLAVTAPHNFGIHAIIQFLTINPAARPAGRHLPVRRLLDDVVEEEVGLSVDVRWYEIGLESGCAKDSGLADVDWPRVDSPTRSGGIGAIGRPANGRTRGACRDFHLERIIVESAIDAKNGVQYEAGEGRSVKAPGGCGVEVSGATNTRIGNPHRPDLRNDEEVGACGADIQPVDCKKI